MTATAVDAGASEVSELLRRARAIVCDFDGTLVDSVPIKRRAFAACFADTPEHLPRILAYCHGNNHTPRGDKFRHVYRHILRQPLTPAREAALHRRFEAETTRQIGAAPETPGASAFLRAVRARRVTALLSSTPHDILLDILRARGWLGWWHTVQGAPVNKAWWLAAFRCARGWAAQDVVFFGDTPEDAEAARQAGCAFVAVRDTSVATASGRAVRDFTAAVLP